MSKIEWTDRTWNPVTGCNKVSQGCKNCYAEVMHRRLMGMFPDKYSKSFLAGPEVHPEELGKPLSWKKPSMVFVNSMSDLFHVDVPLQFILNVFVIMEQSPQHTFQILTKRPENILRYIEWRGKFHTTLPNVWLGVSCEDQAAADERIPLLLQVPAAVRFLSCEPLLGPIDFCKAVEVDGLDFAHAWIPSNIHWVIAGGESAHGARPMHPDWVREIRDQCLGAGIPFFFKQWGEYLHNTVLLEGLDLFDKDLHDFFKVGKAKAGNWLDGRQHLEFPRA